MPAAWPSPLLAGAFFLSGASALVYELLWFRLLGHIFGSTATATSTLLAAYLFGLGLGAWIFGRLSDRLGPRLPLVYIAIELLIGLYGVASHALLERGATLYALAYGWAAGSPGELLFARFAISFVLVAIPTTLMGGSFPLMVHLMRTGRIDAGRATGRAYAINTLGAAVGTIGLPALLLPAFGIATSLAAAALSNFAAAALAFAHVKLTAKSLETATPIDAEAQEDGLERSRPSAAESGEASVPLASGPGASGAGAGERNGSGLRPPPAGPEPGGSCQGPDDPQAALTASDPSRGSAGGLSPSSAILVAFLMSSFASLALETVWTRHLAFLFGAQTFTFAFVLFAYLLGLFLGGGGYSRWRASGGEPGLILRTGLVIAAIGVAAPLPFLDRLAIPQIEMMLSIGASSRSFLLTSGLVTVALILAPAVGFGLVFPAVVDILSRKGRLVGSSVGLTYVVNTVGTTLGALAAGFALVPWVGSQRTLEICVLMLAAALALARWATRPAASSRTPWGGEEDRSPRLWALGYGLPVALLLVVITPRWDWRFAHTQYSKDPLTFLDQYAHGTIWSTALSYKIRYLVEGTEATVSVAEFGQGLRSLYVNGKPDASNVPDDMVAQRLLACLPGLFHPAPKTALVIGLGSGTTVATLKRFPLESVDVAEISPEVSEAAQRYFSDVNDRFLSDPRVSLHLDDGRNFLRFRPPGSYDIIISEPSNPWVAGVSALFTDEFFADAKEKLRPGGIFSQWFHYYNMSVDHIRLLARTFQRHFPEAAIFVLNGGGPTGDIVMIGSKGPLRLARFPEDPTLPDSVRAALVEVGNPGTQQIASGLIATPRDFAAFARTGPLNTDDHPILEFEAPADRFGADFHETLGALIRSSERTFLPAGPLPSDSPALAEITKDGLSVLGELPSGEEVRRGLTVLTRFRKGSLESIRRFVLLGREFDDGTASTGLFRLARPLRRPEELVEIVTSLAGPGAATQSQISVNGHDGLQVVVESEGYLTVAVGWNCAREDRAFFSTVRLPAAGAPAPEAIAADLTTRFMCRHPER